MTSPAVGIPRHFQRTSAMFRWLYRPGLAALGQGHRLKCLQYQPSRCLIGRHEEPPTTTVMDIMSRSADWGSPEYWSDRHSPKRTPTCPLPASQSELAAKRMMDSYQEVVIPLRSNHELRERYMTFFNTVRFGRLLEDMDIMAGLIAYSHNMDPELGVARFTSIGIVTAATDRIDMKAKRIYPDSDIYLRGHVTWVGSSSMEVTINVEQEQLQELKTIIEARFTMVARDTTTNRKALVNPLHVSTLEEKQHQTAGAARKHTRQKLAEQSLLKLPPSEEERFLVHDLFLQTLSSGQATFKRPVKPEGSIWMEDSLLKNVIICFPQQRNIHNKIFGGFLMRKAFELGWATASVYSQMQPTVVAVDDICFRKSVSIGSLLYLSALVVYTSGPYLQVKVRAEVINPKTGHKETTNEFRFTYSTERDTKPSFPKTYAEFMMYLDGKRHHELAMATKEDKL